MNEVRPGSWSELLEVLFEGSWQPSLQRFRSPYAFRGLSDASYRLETTLMRLASRAVGVERHLLRNFRKYAHRDVVERDSIWNWLAVA
ncbi:MAG: FRG domain-containing protein, partial [Acidobacteria bacterium]